MHNSQWQLPAVAGKRRASSLTSLSYLSSRGTFPIPFETDQFASTMVSGLLTAVLTPKCTFVLMQQAPVKGRGSGGPSLGRYHKKTKLPHLSETKLPHLSDSSPHLLSWTKDLGPQK